MKHITEKYGQPCNLLSLNYEDYLALQNFLKPLGVRLRTTIVDGGYNGTCEIQGENPYKIWAGHPHAKKLGDEAMSDFCISCYKR